MEVKTVAVILEHREIDAAQRGEGMKTHTQSNTGAHKRSLPGYYKSDGNKVTRGCIIFQLNCTAMLKRMRVADGIEQDRTTIQI